jgi:hypothetical protein
MREWGIVNSTEACAASEEVSRVLWVALNDEFKDSRIEVLDGPVAFNSLQADAELSQRFPRMQDEFDRLIAGEIKDRRNNIQLSSVIPGLKIMADYDAILLSQGQGLLPTRANKRWDNIWRPAGLLFGVGADPIANVLSIRMLLVDARNGTLLYYCETVAKGNFISNPDVITPFLGVALRKLNQAVALPR